MATLGALPALLLLLGGASRSGDAKMSILTAATGSGAHLPATRVPSARILARTQVFKAAKYGCPGYHPLPPPAPPPPPGPCTSCIRMLPCNASEPWQRWSHPTNGAISPESSAQQCVTRGVTQGPLSISVCRGRAGSLDPVQQWNFNASTLRITDVQVDGVPGSGCVDTAGNIQSGTATDLHVQIPCRNSANEHFLYDAIRGWIYSNCSGLNCFHRRDSEARLQPRYCATAPSATIAQTETATSEAAPGAAENCVPWSIDKNETSSGWYFDAGPTSLALTSNDTLLSFHMGEKYKHLDDNNHGDIILRRSFTQGRTWEPWQLVFSPSDFYSPRVYAAQTGTVLDITTGTIWAMIAVNNSIMVVTSSSNHGASWSEPKDITAASKPPDFGWIAPIGNGVQLKGGRLAICADRIKGQWSAYPITHSVSSMIYSDDHGLRYTSNVLCFAS